MEKNIATGFAPNSSVFFEMVRTHTIQGTFGDPYYGGNANFVVGFDWLSGHPHGGQRGRPAHEREADGNPKVCVRRRDIHDEGRQSWPLS
jgi:hypothetical protein